MRNTQTCGLHVRETVANGHLDVSVGHLASDWERTRDECLAPHRLGRFSQGGLTHAKASVASSVVLESLTQRGCNMISNATYHAQRARTERDLAYRAPDGRVSDAHLRLSALHLSRAMILEEVDRRLGSAAPRPQVRTFA
jgi:hypothetical protein